MPDISPTGLVIYAADEPFVEPISPYEAGWDHKVWAGTRIGAKRSDNFDQIDFYFRAKANGGINVWSGALDNFRKVRAEIENRIAAGQECLGWFNGSVIASLMPVRGKEYGDLRAAYNADTQLYETTGFWQDDDDVRTYVFVKPISRP